MSIKKNKKLFRLRRSFRLRHHLRKLHAVRLVVYKTSKHMYAQIITPNSNTTVASASTLEKKISKSVKYTGNEESASLLGQIIAIRAIKLGIKKVSFDRSGFKYHGRILKLAQSARKFGLIF